MRRGIGRLRAGGGGFNPLSLFAAGEQGGWYDPSDFSTMWQDSAGTTPVTASGQPVGKILDKSGRANHSIQATAASRPVLTQDASGFWYLNYDGVDDGFASAATVNLSGTDKISAFTGLTKNTDASVGMVWELTADTNANTGSAYLDAADDSVTNRYGTLSRGTQGISVAQGSFVTGTGAAIDSCVLTALHDIAGSSSIIRRNGTAFAAGTGSKGTGNFANATFYVGRRGGASLPFNGRIYQLILRGAASDATTIAAAERFIGSRMGIAL